MWIVDKPVLGLVAGHIAIHRDWVCRPLSDPAISWGAPVVHGGGVTVHSSAPMTHRVMHRL